KTMPIAGREPYRQNALSSGAGSSKADCSLACGNSIYGTLKWYPVSGTAPSPPPPPPSPPFPPVNAAVDSKPYALTFDIFRIAGIPFALRRWPSVDSSADVDIKG
ncbi:hypothetical protein V1478_004754, partial [Vespula squamosa]